MIVIYKYATVSEANFKMRGGVVGGLPVNTPFEGLVGLTLTFSSPAGSCTFTQPTGRHLGQMLFADVKAQLEAAIADLEVLTGVGNMLAFQNKTDAPVSLAALDEPARLILGLPFNEAVTGQYLNPPDGAAPRYLEFVSEYGAIYVSAEV